jgi:hypothetical protein
MKIEIFYNVRFFKENMVKPSLFIIFARSFGFLPTEKELKEIY